MWLWKLLQRWFRKPEPTAEPVPIKFPLRAPLTLIDWYGAKFHTFIMYESEVPIYKGSWRGQLATCRRWDSRDWYEFDIV